MSYFCRICGEEWTEIPDGAVEIAATYRGALYRFGGAVHDLRRSPKSVNAEPRTPIMEEPNPPVMEQPVLVQEVIQAPVPEQNLPVEDELAAITTLAHAFRRAERRK